MKEWVRDHRVHHKFSETDADPHNAKRGFFFAHVGWLMMKRHPEVIRKGKTVDISDLFEDPIVAFHERLVQMANMNISEWSEKTIQVHLNLRLNIGISSR